MSGATVAKEAATVLWRKRRRVGLGMEGSENMAAEDDPVRNDKSSP